MNREQSELLLEQVRAMYSKESITDILINLGYEFNKTKKFKIRDSEKTASASVGKNGLIHDFGGRGYDIIKLLTEEKAMIFIEALKLVADNFRITYPEDGYQESEYETQLKRQQIETLKLDRIARREQQERDDQELLMKKQAEARKTIEWYDSYANELQTFRNPEYEKEALAITPMWVFTQATPNAVNHFKHLTTYDPKNKTIVAKIFDYNQQLISYKRRRYLIPGNTEPSKWVTKGGTSPNKQCYIRVDQTSHNPIYIVEGHHDMLTAALLHADEYSSFNFIMVPTENYREFNDYEKGFLIDRQINFIMDVKKEDIKKSAIPMMALASSLPKEEYENAVLIDLFDFLQKNGIDTNHINKLDLSDAIENWTDSLTAFKGSLEYYADTLRAEQELF